ncbi:MAG: terminase large subunit [Microbacterium sp.]
MTSSLPESWPPARWSPPLSPDFPSDGDWLLRLVDLTWRNDDGSPLTLDGWQRQLIRHVLELYPVGHVKAGQLRYREAFVSVGRQNGKSLVGSILAVYGLLRERGALVIGLASSADQARIIYRRLLRLIQTDPLLAKRFQRATDTRGIHATNGSVYEVKASKSAAVQGLAVGLGIVDELHITKPELWTDLVNGTAAKPRGLVFGITTAGDEQSKLLLSLYKRAEEGAGERFGFWIWEAPEAHVPDDDDALADFLAAANPSVAEGRRPIDDELAAVRSMASESSADIIHYRLNRFVASLNPFLPGERWKACARGGGYVWPEVGPLVFALDMTPDDGYATVSAHRKTDDGHQHTELVAWLVNPTFEQLLRLCERLWGHHPDMYAMDGLKLRALGVELRRRGYPVHIGTQADAFNAANLLYVKVMRREITHAGDPLLELQMPRAVRKARGDAYRIDRASSSVEIDAVMATALGTLVLEQVQPKGLQLFA